MSRKRFVIPVIALAVFLLASPALAGGWSVTTLDELPEVIVVDEPITIGFVVRQHGVRIVEGLEPLVTAVHVDSRTRFELTASEDTPGHYSAELLFPDDGVWEWSISAFGPVQPMPSLTVLPARTASPKAETSAKALADDVALAEHGATLFVGKGCVVCHQHSAIDVAPWASINAGPNLSSFKTDPDYLSAWLADPAAIRARANMPDLDLDEEEIEALVAFLNAEARQPSEARTSAGTTD